MFAKLRKLHRDSGGQAMTEAAIVLPLFITVVAMTLELCILASVKSVVNYASYQACRAGIVHNADPVWMKRSAAMSLSPVTQSKLLFLATNFLGVGLPDPEPDNINLGHRLLKFGVYTILAHLQFDMTISRLEYAASYAMEGGLANINPNNYNLNTFGGIMAYANAVQNAWNDVQALKDAPPINQVRILRADTGAVVTNVAGLGGTQRADLTEAGNSKPGVDFIAVRSGRDKALRLRVQVIHQHKLMFPFLKIVYQQIMKGREFPNEDEKKALNRAARLGYIEIASDCTMRMQSHMSMGE